MKKSLIVFGLLVIAAIGQLHAQDSNRIGAQLIYGSNLSSTGIGAIADFPIAEKMVISPSISFYLPKDEGVVKTSAFELNGNLNYSLHEQENLFFYGIGGLNYTSIRMESNLAFFGGSSEFNVSESSIGINLGAGAHMDLGSRLFPFAELKYIVSDLNRLVLAAGVKFNF